MSDEEIQDTGDLLHVPEDKRSDVDPDPKKSHSHAAFGDGGADDVSDVPDGDDEGPPADGAFDDEGDES